MTAMLIDILHVTLEHREEAFNGIGVDSAVNFGNILTLAVMNVAVSIGEQALNKTLVRGLI